MPFVLMTVHVERKRGGCQKWLTLILVWDLFLPNIKFLRQNFKIYPVGVGLKGILLTIVPVSLKSRRTVALHTQSKFMLGLPRRN